MVTRADLAVIGSGALLPRDNKEYCPRTMSPCRKSLTNDIQQVQHPLQCPRDFLTLWTTLRSTEVPEVTLLLEIISRGRCSNPTCQRNPCRRW